MKPSFFILLLTVFTVVFAVTSCGCEIERDATQLAHVQLRRNGVILHMLKSTDSTQIQHCMREVRLLDSEFNQLKQTFDNKYADSAARVQFEKAYSNAMKKN
jgi:hypothetical protein